MSKLLSEIIKGLEILERRGGDPKIDGIAYDSRTVGRGFLFFALPGLHADGRAFVPQAIAAGASAVVHSGELDGYDPRVSYLRVADARFAMSSAAADFYGRPSRDLAVIGVTGTEGKSTTVYLIYQLLKLAGFRAGFISTVMSDSGKGEEPNPEHQTTPEATAVHRMLASMRDAGYGYAVVESSSHGLSPLTNRLGDVEFDVGVMTNVTREHLEFHGTWERYREDKARLFGALGTRGAPKSLSGREVPRFGVVNADDPSADYFRAATAVPVLGFSAAGAPAPAGSVGTIVARGLAGRNLIARDLAASDLVATDLKVDASGESFVIREGASSYPARLELPGAFNVGNALAALQAVSGLTGIAVGSLVPLLPRLRPLRGRMTTVDRGQDFEVIVDYAHTPSSFQTIFPPLRERVKGRIICLFGSAGERDVQKRPRQGRIAADWCDVVVLTDEDPRGEESMALLEEIAAGCPELPRNERLFLIPDRGAAIRKAFSLARSGDLVALLGKGHENSIIYKTGSIPYDEIGEAVSALAEIAEAKSASGAELRSANQEDRKHR